LDDCWDALYSNFLDFYATKAGGRSWEGNYPRQKEYDEEMGRWKEIASLNNDNTKGKKEDTPRRKDKFIGGNEIAQCHKKSTVNNFMERKLAPWKGENNEPRAYIFLCFSSSLWVRKNEIVQARKLVVFGVSCGK